MLTQWIVSNSSFKFYAVTACGFYTFILVLLFSQKKLWTRLKCDFVLVHVHVRVVLLKVHFVIIDFVKQNSNQND